MTLIATLWTSCQLWCQSVCLSVCLSWKLQLSLLPTDKLITIAQPSMTNVTHLRPGNETPPPSISLFGAEGGSSCTMAVTEGLNDVFLCFRSIPKLNLTLFYFSSEG